MTVETVTVLELLARLAFRIEGSNNADTVMRPNYLWALQASMREIVLDLDLESFRTQATLTLSDGVPDYALADDFRRLIIPSMVFTAPTRGVVWHKPYQLHDRHDGDEAIGGSTGKPRYFTLLGVEDSAGADGGKWFVRFFPPPDAGGYQLRYRYFAYPRSIDSDTDGTTVLDRRLHGAWKDAIIAGALLKFPERLTQQEIQVASRDLEVYKRQIRRNNRPYAGDTFQRESSAGTAGRRRWWDGSGTFGSPWAGGVAGPQP